MKPRATPLPEPPERAPYFRVRRGAEVVVLRSPSLHQIAAIVKAVGTDRLSRLAGLAAMVGEGQGLFAVVRGAREILDLVAALVGLTWADPGLELEAARPGEWDAPSLEAYGAAVFEELHEAGWSLSHVVVAALAVVDQVLDAATLEQEVAERARFFLRRRAPVSETSSPPAASSSEDAPAPSDS